MSAGQAGTRRRGAPASAHVSAHVLVLVLALVLALMAAPAPAWASTTVAQGTRGDSTARRATPLRIPSALADTTFWRMITEYSEAGGSFASENLVSNEWELQYEIPSVRARVPRFSAYVGVGPEQNYTYIAAFEPEIAFIVDIRRQNLMQHLMYKALVEQSADRAEFLSRLWAKPRPDSLGAASTAGDLVGRFSIVAPDTAIARLQLAGIFRQLVDVHGFGLTGDDSASIFKVYSAFSTFGPDVSYSFPPAGSLAVGTRPTGVIGSTLPAVVFSPRRPPASALNSTPTFADLMVEEDGQGTNQGWLATEAAFRRVQSYHRRNLIVPVVGDFAGPRALVGIGRYLREHDARVSVFYVSNVEQYLFQSNSWRRFYLNVATLPHDSTSTFIRSIANMRTIAPRHPLARLVQASASMEALLTEFRANRIAVYNDVLMMLR